MLLYFLHYNPNQRKVSKTITEALYMFCIDYKISKTR